MAVCSKFAHSARHGHVQAAVIGVQHATDGAQVFERPVLDGRFSRPGDDANAYRALTIELAMGAATHLPEAVRTHGHDVVVGTPQTPVRAEAYERSQHECRRITLPGVKVQAQHSLTAAVAGAATVTVMRLV